MQAADGKMRLTDVADTEQLFRIIQSIPSPKAEPFKQGSHRARHDVTRSVPRATAGAQISRDEEKKNPGSGGFQGLCLLNHDPTIVYIESLRGMLHTLAAEVVVNAAVSGTLLLDGLDASWIVVLNR